jgi:hypothetical protein
MKQTANFPVINTHCVYSNRYGLLNEKYGEIYHNTNNFDCK